MKPSKKRVLSFDNLSQVAFQEEPLPSRDHLEGG